MQHPLSRRRRDSVPAGGSKAWRNRHPRGSRTPPRHPPGSSILPRHPPGSRTPPRHPPASRTPPQHPPEARTLLWHSPEPSILPEHPPGSSTLPQHPVGEKHPFSWHPSTPSSPHPSHVGQEKVTPSPARSRSEGPSPGLGSSAGPNLPHSPHIPVPGGHQPPAQVAEPRNTGSSPGSGWGAHTGTWGDNPTPSPCADYDGPVDGGGGPVGGGAGTGPGTAPRRRHRHVGPTGAPTYQPPLPRGGEAGLAAGGRGTNGIRAAGSAPGWPQPDKAAGPTSGNVPVPASRLPAHQRTPVTPTPAPLPRRNPGSQHRAPRLGVTGTGWGGMSWGPTAPQSPPEGT